AGAKPLRRARLADRIAHFLVDITDVLLELADALADGRPDLRNSSRSEKYEHDDQDHQQLGEAKIAEIHNELLKERTSDEIGDEYANKTKEGHVQGHRSQRKLDHTEVDGQWADRGSDARRQELFRRPGRKQNAGGLLHHAPDHEPDGQDQSMKPRTMLR